MTRTFNFDMDGTIADLYGVEGWLDKLLAHDPTPYADATPLVNLSRLAYYINKAQRNGWRVNIVSWLSKENNADYNEAVTKAKIDWLARHLPPVHFDAIVIVPYGTPKHELAKGILFDDEQGNRMAWNDANKSNHAFDESVIFQVMRDLLT